MGALQVMKLMYLPAFDLLVLPCHDKRLLIVDVAAGYKTIQALPLKVMVRGCYAGGCIAHRTLLFSFFLFLEFF